MSAMITPWPPTITTSSLRIAASPYRASSEPRININAPANTVHPVGWRSSILRRSLLVSMCLSLLLDCDRFADSAPTDNSLSAQPTIEPLRSQSNRKGFENHKSGLNRRQAATTAGYLVATQAHHH